MTREEVKAQLAKSPLEWTRVEPLSENKTVHTATIPMDMDPKNRSKYSIEYRVEEVDGYGDLELSIYESHGLDGKQYCHIYVVSTDVPNVKEYSEEHRLNLVCSLLGIKE